MPENKNSNNGRSAVPLPSPCSAGFGQTRTLTMDDVIIALRSIGLGGKLVNAALVEMGYKLVPFPMQNNHSPVDIKS